MLLKLFRRTLQIKKIITNAPCALQFPYSHNIFSRKGWMVIRLIQHSLNKQQKTFLKLYRKRCNNWPMMCFIQSKSGTRIYRISSGTKLDGMYCGQLSQHNSLTSLDDDAENFLLNFLVHLQITNINLYMATQNCVQNKGSLQNQKYLPNLKQDLRELHTNSLKQLFLELHL